MVNLHAVHMDPRLFDNPEDFNPERWLDEDGKIKRQDTLIPFSIGNYSCVIIHYRFPNIKLFVFY